MALAFNPRDSSSFASGSLDGAVKIWNLTMKSAMYTIDAHEKGVNSLDYFKSNDKPYLVTASDDGSIKVWDYQNKSLVGRLVGHSGPVNAVICHPHLPLICSASEDGTIRLWSTGTLRLESTINVHLDRLWCLSVAHLQDSELGLEISVGGDTGMSIVRVGRKEAVISMDEVNGKLIWAQGQSILTASIRASSEGITGEEPRDGQELRLSPKDLGHSDTYSTRIQHSPNGRWVAVSDSAGFVVYTAVAWRNKAFGRATDFCWSADGNDYALKDSSNSKIILVHPNFSTEPWSIKVEDPLVAIFGGPLIGAITKDSVYFFDWQEGNLQRDIEVEGAQNVQHFISE